MITVIINSSDNATQILDCLDSTRTLTDSVIVVDMESVDGTPAIARGFGATVIPCHNPTRYVEPARMVGIAQAPGDWIFILDTDERLTPELAEEIKQKLQAASYKLQENLSQLESRSLQLAAPTHYRVPRKNIFGKTWLRHGGWWPDRQIRLIRKSALRGWPARIHSTPEIDGSSATLLHPILHYFHGDIASMVTKTTVFEDVESDLLYQAGRPVSVLTFFRKFWGELSRRLIKNEGFRDGTAGWIESIYQAYSKTITYLYLYEKKYIKKP